MPNINDNRPGRPANLNIPFHMAKNLWDQVWEKFCVERGDKIKNLTNGANLEILAQIVEIDLEPVKKLKREIERTPSPNAIAMSKSAISGLCDYLQVVQSPYFSIISWANLGANQNPTR